MNQVMSGTGTTDSFRNTVQVAVATHCLVHLAYHRAHAFDDTVHDVATAASLLSFPYDILDDLRHLHVDASTDAILVQIRAQVDAATLVGINTVVGWTQYRQICGMLVDSIVQALVDDD